MTTLDMKLEGVRSKLHEVRDEWHETCHDTACLGPIMNSYIDEVIDLTETMDIMKDECGEPKEVEY